MARKSVVRAGRLGHGGKPQAVLAALTGWRRDLEARLAALAEPKPKARSKTKPSGEGEPA